MLLLGRQLINFSYLYITYIGIMYYACARYLDIQMYLKAQCQRAAANVLSQAVRGFWPYLFLLLYAYADIYTHLYE